MRYRDACFHIYWKLRDRIAPALEYSQTVYERVLNECVRGKRQWLDLGCGHQLLPSWRYEQECALVKCTERVVGLDYDFDSLTKHRSFDNKVRGDINNLPFDDNTFDIVTANMVFEHLENPVQQVKDIHRILVPGGLLIFHTPNAMCYDTIAARLIPEYVKSKVIRTLHGRSSEDVFRAYYKINTARKIENIARVAGLQIESIEFITSDAQLVVFPPLVVFELLLLRILMLSRFKAFRTNLIAKLRKPQN